MEPTALLQTKIPTFPGYADEDSRRLADELVRSYLGEALADLRIRLQSLPADPAEQLNGLILRTGFANQRSVRGYEEGARDDGNFAAVAAADAAIVELADRAGSIDAQQLTNYLSETGLALDRRDEIMRTYGQEPPVTTPAGSP